MTGLETSVISLLWWILVKELHWTYLDYGFDLSENLDYSFGEGFEFD